MPSLKRIKLFFVKQKGLAYESVKTAAEVTNLAKRLFNNLKDETQEVFCVLHLNSRLNVIGYHEAFRGGFDSCPVDCKVIFQAALLSGARAIILVHNHPSDHPQPSRHDLEITKKIKRAAEHLDIQVLDHIIVSGEECYSFKENELEFNL